jgi:oligopeptide/dipeptide ABC transporter ATP-binding protein
VFDLNTPQECSAFHQDAFSVDLQDKMLKKEKVSNNFWHKFARNKAAVVGLGTVVVMTLLGILAPVIAPYNPNSINLAQTFRAPLTEGHPLGTDDLGRDLFSRILYGARMSILVALSSTLTRKEAKQRAIAVLKSVGIPDAATRFEAYPFELSGSMCLGLDGHLIHRYPHEFSGGQRQRINIARVLALNPRLIVCDEPVSALDISIQAQVINLFIRLQRAYGLTYVFISHDLGVVRHVSDIIAVMYLGTLVEYCVAEEIYKTPLHPYTQALLSAVPTNNPFEFKKQTELEGEIRGAIGRNNGCPLKERCPCRMRQCWENVPSLKNYNGDGHQVACFLYHEV